MWLVPRGGKDDTIGDTILGCGYISLSELLAANHTPATAAQVLSRDFILLSRDFVLLSRDIWLHFAAAQQEATVLLCAASFVCLSNVGSSLLLKIFMVQ